jgi:hypothetical protein
MKSPSCIAALLLGVGLAAAKLNDRALDPRRAGQLIREAHEKRVTLDGMCGVRIFRRVTY